MAFTGFLFSSSFRFLQSAGATTTTSSSLIFQEYFRNYKPKLLAVWGNKDPFFLPPGAEAYKRDNPNAIVKFYSTGHFALETHVKEIGDDILKFMGTLPK